MPYILPEEGKFAQVAGLLLDLADRPRDVATSTDGVRLGFVVSDDLYERYQKANGKKAPGKSDAEE
jgi:hypothetical protein